MLCVSSRAPNNREQLVHNKWIMSKYTTPTGTVGCIWELPHRSIFEYQLQPLQTPVGVRHPAFVQRYGGGTWLSENTQIFELDCSYWRAAFQWGQFAYQRWARQIIRPIFKQGSPVARVAQNKKIVSTVTKGIKIEWHEILRCFFASLTVKLQLESLVITEFTFYCWVSLQTASISWIW